MPNFRGCHIGLALFLIIFLSHKEIEVRSHRIKRDYLDESEEEIPEANFYHGVDGVAGVDYPALSYIPRTNFNCAEMETGYYADTETGCQVFHICNEGIKVSFLCPNGTIFHQSELICEWWFKVNCSISPLLYEESAEHYHLDSVKRKESRRVTASTSKRPTTAYQNVRSSTDTPLRLPTHRRPPSRTPYREEKERPKKIHSSNEETQVFEETSSFVRSHFNSVSPSSKSSEDDAYPNHKKSYSDLEDPEVSKKSYSKLPEKTSPRTIPLESATVSSTTKSYNNFHKNAKTSGGCNGRGLCKKVESYEGSEGTEANVYEVPKDYNMEGVAVLTSRRADEKDTTVAAKVEEIQEDLSKVKPLTESKLIFLKTTTESSARAAFENSPDRKTKLEKSLDGMPSLDFKIKSVVLNSYEKPTIDTENDFLTRTTNFENSKIWKTTTPGPFSGKTHDFESSSKNDFVYTTAHPRGFSLSSNNKRQNTKFVSSTINDINSNFDRTTTLPTSYDDYTSTSPSFTETANDNMKTVVNSLIKVAEERLSNDKQIDFSTNRPGLDVPPSVSPKTLHTLALYFANAADINHIHPQDDFVNFNITESEEKAVVDLLLTEATKSGYDDLFKEKTNEPDISTTEETISTSVASEENDKSEPKTSVKELARLFTSALSSYLHDPEDFKKTLESVRPTDPSATKPESSTEEEEVLSFSDTENVKKPTGSSGTTTDAETSSTSTLSPTTTQEIAGLEENFWTTTEKPASTDVGVVYAYNPDVSYTDNTIDENGERLQTSDSQSFLAPNRNDFDDGQTRQGLKIPEKLLPPLPQPFKPRSTSDYETTTTEILKSTEDDDLPNNHWTTSSDVTKLLQTALALDPLTVNYLTTSNLQKTTEPTGFSEIEAVTKTSTEILTTEENNRFNRVLHAIMKNTSNEHERVKMILNKLNLTEEEFRKKMREIDANPLAKKLVILLLNKCKDDEEVKTTTEVQFSEDDTTTHPPSKNIFRKYVDETLTDDSEDTRALQLLNSLYVIATKFNT